LAPARGDHISAADLRETLRAPAAAGGKTTTGVVVRGDMHACQPTDRPTDRWLLYRLGNQTRPQSKHLSARVRLHASQAADSDDAVNCSRQC